MYHFRVRRNKTRIFAGLIIGSFLLQTGCGTLFYPERRGQTSGRIDPTVAILNGIGLFFFLIPGIIAFVVDISTGAIYLPPEDGQAPEPVTYLNPDEMTPERIAEVIRAHTGVEVALSDQDMRIMRLEESESIAERFQSESSGH